MKNKKVKTSKTPKTRKYYYSKASILRSAIVSILCLAVFVAFFVCFMIYGGNDRNPLATYKTVFDKEREVLSMIDGIAADDEGRVYVFYSRTFEINVYDESGKYLESYQIPCGDGESESICDGGIACMDGKLYAFNEYGKVFVYENGKAVSSFEKFENEEKRDKFTSISKKYDEEKNKVITASGKTFINNYFSVTDGDGNVIVDVFPVGIIFSPFSMIMAIIMTILTYLSVRRYNKKVRNEKIKTFFKKNVAVK
jgi:hypothetical protein